VAFEAPFNIVELNTSATEGAPALSADGTRMIFHSNRPGGGGGLDLWMARRDRVN
jgi:hypothetical protein